MSQLGLGTMLSMFSDGGSTARCVKAALGKKIKAIALNADGRSTTDCLTVAFTDDTGIKLWDDGQSCCERRYMTCGDDLTAFSGATLMGIEVADGPGTTDKYCQPHDIQFLRVLTSDGVVTVETHNEHNGYYGGFSVKAREWKAPT
ncbi:MAG: hypothetical protein WC505_07610 [Patescibacteria group bacterium]